MVPLLRCLLATPLPAPQHTSARSVLTTPQQCACATIKSPKAQRLFPDLVSGTGTRQQMLSQATSQDSVQQRGVPDLDPQRKLSLLRLLGTEEKVRSQVLFSCIYFTFFQYLFISVSQVTDQQESLQRAYPVVPEQTPLLSKAAYVAGAPKGASHVDSHLEAQHLDAGTGFL